MAESTIHLGEEADRHIFSTHCSLKFSLPSVNNVQEFLKVFFPQIDCGGGGGGEGGKTGTAAGDMPSYSEQTDSPVI